MEVQCRVQLIAHTPQPERVVAAAAKLCYSDAAVDELLSGLDEEKSRRFVEMLASLGHESPLEHAVFTFGIEGVSRALLAQITRHRIASFSVQSQRYVRLADFDYVVPPEVAADEGALALFHEEMNRQAGRYCETAALLEKGHYARFVAEGLDEKEAKRKAEKLANEDARFLLPNACATKMMVTMNARSLLNFFRLRCCERAQWEIHRLADEMLRLVVAVAPALFASAGPGCAAGGCTEGKMSCGRAAQVRQKYDEMKKEAAHG